MEKALFLLACVVAMTLPAQTQRLIPKQREIEVVGSLSIIKGEKPFVEDNLGLSLSLTHYSKHENYTLIGSEYEQQNMSYRDHNIKPKDVLLRLGYMHPLLSDSGKNVLLYGGISALGGCKELGEDKSSPPDRAKSLGCSYFIYGDTLYLSVKCLLTDSVLLLFKGQGQVLFGTDVHRFCSVLPAGLKSNLQYQGTMKNKVMNSIWVMRVFILVVFCLSACGRELDAQQSYPSTVETMPVQKDVVRGQTTEIKCTLKRGGSFADTRYTIRYFQPDGRGTLRMDNGTVLKPNDCHPLTRGVFRLYYTPVFTDRQTIDTYVENNFGQIVKPPSNSDNGKNEDTPKAIEKALI